MAHHHNFTMNNYWLCINNLCLPARIGVYDSEYHAPQMIQLDLRIQVDQNQCQLNNTGGVPCYATICQQLGELLLAEQTPLCEQLAEKIAKVCFDDSRIIALEVAIIKPHALSQADVGVKMNFCR